MIRRYRFSGSLTIALRLLDGETPDGRARYECRVSVRGVPASVVPAWRGTVNSPAFRAFADDSPRAFTRIARAALDFAEHDGFGVNSYADFTDGFDGDGDGYALASKPPKSALRASSTPSVAGHAHYAGHNQT